MDPSADETSHSNRFDTQENDYLMANLASLNSQVLGSSDRNLKIINR